MPVQPTYPGVYIEEIPSGVRTITGVATSIAAFIGRAPRGIANEPVMINSWADFERKFGGLAVECPLSYAVRDFYLNGGQQALIVRLHNGAVAAQNSDLKLEAISPGAWGKKMTYAVDSNGISDELAARYGLDAADLFNLTVYENPGKGKVERFLNVAVNADAGARRLDRVLEAASNLVRVQKKSDGSSDLAATKPADSTPAEDPARTPNDDTHYKKFTLGTDGTVLAQSDLIGNQDNKTGLYALEKADLFNLLCIPPDSRVVDTSMPVNQSYPYHSYAAAMQYCTQRRAVLIVDAPAYWSANKETGAAKALEGLDELGLTGEAARNAALYFPWVMEADPLRDGQIDTFAPCGIIAGVMARTDMTRGVWKAPAGIAAAINGVQALAVNLTDSENGMLNPQGINCLRSFPAAGRVVWGSRTLRGTDQLADEYKYIPIRRLALFIEESLYRGTQWVVFEPNDEPLWAQIRLNIGAFMHNLFRQGAFQGQTPKDAYFVKCDKETTTQNDINLGIVNIIVGFAPLKPAEFVIIKLQQMAGQIEA
jgi:phage tail sheath protein FI